MVQIEDLIFIGLLLVAGILFMKFIYWTVGKDFSRWGRYQRDQEFRRQEITKLDGVLKENPEDARSLLLRAQLWRMEGDNQKAREDLRAYLTIKDEDSEGWAELGECALVLGDAELAVEAGDKAVALDGAYGDYRALRLRAALLAGDTETARSQLVAWQEIDRKRLAAGNKRKSIFKSDDRHFGELVPDPALIAYEAAVAQAEGKPEAAAGFVSKMKNEYSELWSVLCEKDPLIAKLQEV